MFKESIKMLGTLNVFLTDQFGAIKVDENYSNLVVQSGKEFIAKRMIGTSVGTMSYLAIGTGTNTPINTDIILQHEVVRSPLQSASVSANTVTYVSYFAPGAGTGAITEAGIFNSDTVDQGSMLCRTVFPVVNKEAGDTLTITWNVSPN